QHQAAHPRRGEALFFLGESLVQQGRYADAAAHFARFHSAHPDHPFARQALFRLGETAFLQGEVDQARDKLEQFRSQYPDDPLLAYALPYLGGAWLASAAATGPDTADQAAKAESWYRQALEGHPQGPLSGTCRLGLARAQHLQDKLAEAAAAYQELLESPDPTLPIQANYYLATIFFQQDQLDLAARHFALVLSLDPQSRWAQACHGPLAVCEARAGRLPEARQAFHTWQQQGKEEAGREPLLFHLAEAALRQKDLAWAEQLFAMLIDSPRPVYRARGLSGLAWVHYHADKPAAALARFQQLVSQYPDDPLTSEAIYLQALLLEQAQRPEEALAAYRAVVENHPQHPQRSTALLHAGVLLEQQQQAEEAERLYLQLIREQPEGEAPIDAARYRLAWLLRDADRTAEAVEQFAVLYDQHRDSSYWPDATWRLAEAAFQRGEAERAGQIVTELLAADPPAAIRGHALYLQARMARSAEDWPAMEKRLNQLVTELPDHPLRATAEFWLAEAAYQQEHFEAAAQRLGSLAAEVERLDGDLQPVVLLRQAQLRAHQKDWSASLQLARQVEAEFPQFPQRAELQYVIGRGLVADARFQEAREAFLQAAPRDGSLKTETAAMAQWMIGETYMHQENYAQALREYLRVQALYAYPQWQAAGLLQAAKCYEQLNQPQQAAALYRQIVELYPGEQVAAEAARRLSP
nr:tetratricopeptide repeat protein [Planctomycetales bacterium]